MGFCFDLQRFGGGKGGTTITQTYEPTKWELGLQELEYNYSASSLMPAAELLSADALNLLNQSGGSIPVHYDDLFLDADAKIAAGIAGLAHGIADMEKNAAPAVSDVSREISKANQNYLEEITDYDTLYLSGENGLMAWLNGVPVELYQDLKERESGFISAALQAGRDCGGCLQKAEKRLALIPSEYLSANAELDSALTTYDEGIADKASENYSDLDFLIPEFKTVADSTNQELRPLKENVIRKADSLSWICPPVKITPTCSAL